MKTNDFRSLAGAEVLTFEHYINSPHQDKDWHKYFLADKRGYKFFTVFLRAVFDGEAVRLNDILNVFIDSVYDGEETIKKKIQEGVEKKIIHRHVCEEDARTKIYYFNQDILDEVSEYLVYTQEQRMINILEAFEDIYTTNIIKSFMSIFLPRYGKDISIKIIKTLCSQPARQNIFEKKQLPLE